MANSRSFIPLYCLLTLVNVVGAQQSVVVDREKFVPLGDQCLYLEDPGNDLTVDDVTDPLFLSKFHRSTHTIPNFGFTGSAYWIRVDVYNASPETTFTLEVGNPLLDQVEVYFARDANGVSTGQARLQRIERRANERNPSFDIELPQRDSLSLFLRVSSSTALVVPLVLWDEDEHEKNVRDELLILGMYYGILLVLIVYNTLLFFSMREPVYIQYSGLILCFAVSQLTFDGFFSLYLPGFGSWTTGRIFPVAFALMIVIAHVLTQRLLGTKTHTPSYHRIMNLVIFGGALWFIITPALPLELSHRITPVLTTAAILMLLPPAFFRWKEGYRPAKPFFIAICALSIALLVRMFRNVGVLTDITLTVHPVHVGSLIDAILLSISLSDRINLRKIEEEVGKYRLRDRLAQDLHDDLASTLSSISLFTASLARTLKRPSREVRQLLERISRLALDSVDTIGDIVWSVSPEQDTLQHLLVRMRDFTSEVCTANNIRYALRLAVDGADARIDADHRRHVYLIFKEAMNNAVRHSNASMITVEARLEKDVFELRIGDDGQGIRESSARKGGHGMANMEKRAKEIGAALKIESSSKGTLIVLRRRMT